MLNPNELSALGFAIVEAVFDRTAVTELGRVLETADLDRSRAGARHLMNYPKVSRSPQIPAWLPLRSGSSERPRFPKGDRLRQVSRPELACHLAPRHRPADS
jgi:hypothetical protein